MQRQGSAHFIKATLASQPVQELHDLRFTIVVQHSYCFSVRNTDLCMQAFALSVLLPLQCPIYEAQSHGRGTLPGGRTGSVILSILRLKIRFIPRNVSLKRGHYRVTGVSECLSWSRDGGRMAIGRHNSCELLKELQGSRVRETHTILPKGQVDSGSRWATQAANQHSSLEISSEQLMRDRHGSSHTVHAVIPSTLCHHT